jgi:threonine aldolase
VHRLADDHANARLLSEGLARLVASHPILAHKAAVHTAQTNILFTDIATDITPEFLKHLAQNNVKVTASNQRGEGGAITRIRWVTHLDVNRSDVERALEVVRAF